MRDDDKWRGGDDLRPLTDAEVADRMQRVGGDATCKTCGKLLRKHPCETRVNWMHLVRLCNGGLGKL